MTADRTAPSELPRTLSLLDGLAIVIGLMIGADVQYSHVPGILGTAGVSQQAGEDDLGGVAARFKLIVGR